MVPGLSRATCRRTRLESCATLHLRTRGDGAWQSDEPLALDALPFLAGDSGLPEDA